MSNNNVYDIEHHQGTYMLKVNKETSNDSNKNFNNQSSTQYNYLNHAPFLFFTNFGIYLPILSIAFLEAYASLEYP